MFCSRLIRRQHWKVAGAEGEDRSLLGRPSQMATAVVFGYKRTGTIF
jgi:hypothetical protein